MKTVVEYLCDPEKFSFCKKISDKADSVSSDKIPVYWGILGLAVEITGTMISGSGWHFNWDLSAIGWSIMKYSSLTFWSPSIIMWIIRLFVPNNETVNWLYVLTSNLTMLGPILLYWVSIIMIVVGWIADQSVTFEAVLKWLAWIVLAFIASFYQIEWIGDIRDLYSGDLFTGTKELEKIDTEISDTVESTVDTVESTVDSVSGASL